MRPSIAQTRILLSCLWCAHLAQLALGYALHVTPPTRNACQIRSVTHGCKLQPRVGDPWINSRSMSNTNSPMTASVRGSGLFSVSPRSSALSGDERPALFRRLVVRSKRLANMTRRLRRGFLAMMAATMIWWSAASFPAAASTNSAASPLATMQERIVTATSPSVDTIVDRYVREHLFDEDAYDPVESLYRESYHDKTVGSYPQALREATASVLGDQTKDTSVAVDSKLQWYSPARLGSLLGVSFDALQNRGLSETTAIAVITGLLVVGLPSSMLLGSMVVAGMGKRRVNRLMKDRYGDSYTVDATIKPEEDIEAPDDDEDDDDDDEE